MGMRVVEAVDRIRTALLLGLPIAMYGPYCIHLSNAGVDDKLSDYLLATRGEELHGVCKTAADFQDLQRVRFLYQEKSTCLLWNQRLKLLVGCDRSGVVLAIHSLYSYHCECRSRSG